MGGWRSSVAGRVCANSIFAALLFIGSSVFWLASADPNRIARTMLQQFGSSAEGIVSAWAVLSSQKISPAPLAEASRALAAVNDFFNTRIRNEDDLQIWGVDDYWATPGELLAKGAGDAEDFAIAKYLTLREMGLPDQNLRLIFVRKGFRGAPSRVHMVLGFYPSPGAIPLILDNLDPAIKPASERNDLTPVSSFNAAGMWLGADSAAKSSGTGLSKWQAVLERARREGFN